MIYSQPRSAARRSEMASKEAEEWWDEIGMYLIRERWRDTGCAGYDAGRLACARDLSALPVVKLPDASTPAGNQSGPDVEALVQWLQDYFAKSGYRIEDAREIVTYILAAVGKGTSIDYPDTEADGIVFCGKCGHRRE
jgi:hypothetical protein